LPGLGNAGRWNTKKRFNILKTPPCFRSPWLSLSPSLSLSLSQSLSLRQGGRGAAEPKLRSKNSPIIHKVSQTAAARKIVLLCGSKRGGGRGSQGPQGRVSASSVPDITEIRFKYQPQLPPPPQLVSLPPPHPPATSRPISKFRDQKRSLSAPHLLVAALVSSR
jgi:hypothetical protein